MKNLSKLLSSRLVLAVVAGLVTASASSHAQSAIATISDVSSGSVFDYTINLKNTGSLNLNSFWYGWTTSGNNLASNPTTPWEFSWLGQYLGRQLHHVDK
jgi:hypothetical protein